MTSEVTVPEAAVVATAFAMWSATTPFLGKTLAEFEAMVEHVATHDLGEGVTLEQDFLLDWQMNRDTFVVMARQGLTAVLPHLSTAPAQAPGELVERLTRPIIGIENRSAQEAFNIMADRIRHAIAALSQEQRGAAEVKPPSKLPSWWRPSDKLAAALKAYRAVKADFEAFDGDRRGIAVALGECEFGILTAIAADHVDDDDDNYFAVKIMVDALAAALAATPVHQEAGE